MAAPPVKPPLHNFPLTFLKWNTKKQHRSSSPPSPSQTPSSPPSQPPLHIPVGSRSSRNRRPSTPLPLSPQPEPEPEPEQIEKQWNFRPRRGINTSVPANGGGSGTTVVDAAEREKRKLWLSLSREEIEEDIYSLTGSKPSRRPRKRSKIVQKQLDAVFPGLWLIGVAPDSYRTFDPPPKK